jgi:hypothetical protein
MNEKPDPLQPDRLSLKRWSRRKLEMARAQTAPAREPAASPEAPVVPSQPVSQPVERVATNATPALPPVDSLTIDSEFAAFFKADVPEATKRAALKQLFRDPRFNIMDGLDVYIDDYTQPDPIPPEMMKRLLHTRHIFNPPKTEVNAEGHVVDVVEPVERAEPQAAPDAPAAIATSGGAGEANPESLPRASDESAEPARLRQGDTKP